MKITLDLKSLILGFITAGLIITGFSFKNAETEKPGKFQSVMGTNGVMILDTETGAYVMAYGANAFEKTQWSKGDFSTAFETGRNLPKKN